jgi:hypothetical protein
MVGHVLVVVLVLTVIAMIAPGFLRADEEQIEEGDPMADLPGSEPLDPTPGIFSDWMILMAMAFQLAL